MRVLHLPTAVGGGPTGLARGLRRLGIETEVWAIDQDYLAYPVDRVLMDPSQSLLRQLLAALAAGGYVLGRWDVVHFNYGSTLFSQGGKLLSRRQVGGSPMMRAVSTFLAGVSATMQRLELAVLRLRRIPYFVLYQGDDARQGDYSLEHFPISIATQVPNDYYTSRSDAWKRRQIALMTRHAAGVHTVNPDLLHVLPAGAEFVPYGHVAIDDVVPVYPSAARMPLRFAHAPSNRAVKGTELILEALASLADEGYEFDLDLIEGVPNDEALARYRDADVVIDQLFAGWYGGVAVEAMALGKPVVVYLREDDLALIPEQMAAELPFFRAEPATIRETLRQVLELPRADLVARARRSRAYVERWHDPAAISERFAAAYRRARKSSRREGGRR